MTKPVSLQPVIPSNEEWYANPVTLAFILEVIKLCTLPTHVNAVPKNFGYAAAGSMKAEEWRVLSMVYIPLALCILWNDIDGHIPLRDHGPLRWLDTSMALFQAITLMCRYSTSITIANRVRNHLFFWTNTLHDVFPHTKDHPLRPNRHVILHIPDFLVLFGPVMFWWAFPFERLIGHLQTLNTNNIIGGKEHSVINCSIYLFASGAMEMTLLQSYLRSANFRRWLATPNCPPIITSLRDVLKKAFWHTKYQERSDQFHHTPKEVAHYPANGVSFARAAHHIGNSIILYQVSGVDQEICAGSIQKIELDGDKAFCYVTKHACLPASLHDPFARYPDFPAVTYSSQLLTGTVKIELKDVITHAARLEFTHNRTVFLSLSRVSFSYSTGEPPTNHPHRFLWPIGRKEDLNQLRISRELFLCPLTSMPVVAPQLASALSQLLRPPSTSSFPPSSVLDAPPRIGTTATMDNPTSRPDDYHWYPSIPCCLVARLVEEVVKTVRPIGLNSDCD